MSAVVWVLVFVVQVPSGDYISVFGKLPFDQLQACKDDMQERMKAVAGQVKQVKGMRVEMAADGSKPMRGDL